MVHWIWLIISAIIGGCIAWVSLSCLVMGKQADMWFAIQCAVYNGNLNPCRKLLELPVKEKVEN